jgi:antitoxin ParD1/3/4
MDRALRWQCLPIVVLLLRNGNIQGITMPSRNVNLTEELDNFVLAKIDTGRYENASEVIRAALRTLEREEQQFEAKLAALRTAIDQGDASGAAPALPRRT